MKILHLSHGGLPDPRIVRAAGTCVNAGYENYFCGLATSSRENGVFIEIRSLDWTPKAKLKMPIAWTRLKSQFNKILNELRPDIIHAHNVPAAKLASESGYPFVFDDHEHVSAGLKAISESNERSSKKEYLSRVLTRRLWSEWEKDLVQTAPTITVSKTIAQDYETLGGRVFVVPNLPSKDELNNNKQITRTTTISSIYVGVENPEFIPPYRDITGFAELFDHHRDIGELTILGKGYPHKVPNVRYVEFLPRHEMYSELFKHNIGLMPWKRHWFHRYCSPNKVYEYARSGLFVVLTDDFTEVISMLDGNCTTFKNYEDLVVKLLYLKEHLDGLDKLRQKALNFARENLFWEKYEHHIFDAYKVA